MKKLYALSVLFCTALLFADAQKNFIKQIPLTWGQCVVPTSDGGYLLTGTRNATKYAANDEAVWTIRVDDSTQMEFSKVIPTKDGGYIALAQTTRPFDENNSFRPEVYKLNKAGKIIWQKAFYGYQATDIAEDNAGNFVLAYYTFGDVTASHLVKLDANGNAIWWRHFSDPYSDSYISAIKITKDNRYAVAGLVNEYANFSIFDSSGNQVVNKTFSYAAGLQTVLEKFGNGDFLFITNENNYGANAYINRLTNTGDIVWQKILSQKGTYTNFSAAVISGNTITLAGYKTDRSTFLSTALIITALKDNGKLVSQKTVSIPVSPDIVSATRLKNGSFIVLASNTSYHFVTRLYNNSYVLRFDPNGNVCNAAADSVNTLNNAITTRSSLAYTAYTLNPDAPILTFTTSYNLTETKLCDGNDGLIAAAAEKAVAATTINNHNFTVATYPNPAVNKVAIKITLSKAGPVKLDLMDMFGKTVQQYDYTLPVGVTIKDINVSSLPGGTYLLKLTCGTELITTKISKQ